MGLCKGNRGNLMQHWTLSECLLRLQAQFGAVHLVAAHSMAPWAVPTKEENPGACRSTFLRAGACLGTINAPCRYELAWKRLSIDGGLPYPSSAVFATEMWKGSQLQSARPILGQQTKLTDGLPCPNNRADFSTAFYCVVIGGPVALTRSS